MSHFFPPFVRAHGGDIEAKFDRLQETLERCFQFINEFPIINGRLIEDVTIAGGGAQTNVPHTLQRVPRGYIIVDDQNGSAASAGIGRDAWDDVNITFSTNVAASAQTVSLWVF